MKIRLHYKIYYLSYSTLSYTHKSQIKSQKTTLPKTPSSLPQNTSLHDHPAHKHSVTQTTKHQPQQGQTCCSPDSISKHIYLNSNPDPTYYHTNILQLIISLADQAQQLSILFTPLCFSFVIYSPD